MDMDQTRLPEHEIEKRTDVLEKKLSRRSFIFGGLLSVIGVSGVFNWYDHFKIKAEAKDFSELRINDTGILGATSKLPTENTVRTYIDSIVASIPKTTTTLIKTGEGIKVNAKDIPVTIFRDLIADTVQQSLENLNKTTEVVQQTITPLQELSHVRVTSFDGSIKVEGQDIGLIPAKVDEIVTKNITPKLAELNTNLSTKIDAITGESVGSGISLFSGKNGSKIGLKSVKSSDNSVLFIQSPTEIDIKLNTSGGGDMLKSVYDSDSDGKVNSSVTSDTANNSNQLGGVVAAGYVTTGALATALSAKENTFTSLGTAKGGTGLSVIGSPGQQLVVNATGTGLTYSAPSSAPVTSVNSQTGAVVLSKTDIGLSNVDNTSDLSKAVFSATKLSTPRTINGIAFDGTSNIVVADPTKEPIITSLPVSKGGTNLTTLGTAGQVLTVNTAGTALEYTALPVAPVTSVNGQTGVVTVTKTQVGLNNVDNTSDVNKPVSTAQQTAINLKENTLAPGTITQYYRGDKTWQTLDKTTVGLSNVDNTTDLLKPISTATQTALNTKENAFTTLPITKGGTNLSTLGTAGQVLSVNAAGTGLVYNSLPSAPVTSVNGQTGAAVVTQSDVGLSNVDNTSDVNKPVSTAQQTALNLKENLLPVGTATQYLKGDKTLSTLDIAAVSGLSLALLGKASVTHNHSASDIVSGTLSDSLLSTNVQLKSEKGVANGYVPLNASTKIDSTYLPSYVDDVLEFNTLSLFPVVGTSGVIYIAADTNRQYRWTGTNFVDITGFVDSVFGRTGAVTAQNGDYSANQITNTPAGNIAATTVQAALNELDLEKSNVGHIHTASSVVDFDEAVQDSVGGSLTNTSSVQFTYNDSTNQISASVLEVGLTTVEKTSQKGLAGGYAGLDATGVVPAVQLPTSVATASQTANNGLTKTLTNVQLGGALTQNTTIDLGNFAHKFSKSAVSTGGVEIDSGTSGVSALKINQLNMAGATGVADGILGVDINGVVVKASQSSAASIILPSQTGNAGKVLSTDGLGATSWVTAAAGEINTASNLGLGTQLFKQKTLANLEFKSLTSTDNSVTFTTTTDTANLSVTAPNLAYANTINTVPVTNVNQALNQLTTTVNSITTALPDTARTIALKKIYRGDKKIKGVMYWPRKSPSQDMWREMRLGFITFADIDADLDQLVLADVNTVRVFTFYDHEFIGATTGPGAITPAAARAANIGWTDGLGWYNTLYQGYLTTFIDHCNARGLDVVVTMFQELKALKDTDNWTFLTTEVTNYANFTTWLITSIAVKPNVLMMILKNEPDGYGVWDDYVLAGKVLTFLNTMKAAIKVVAPDMPVVVNCVSYDNNFKKFPAAPTNAVSIYDLTDILAQNTFLWAETGWANASSWDGSTYRRQFDYMRARNYLSKPMLMTECGYPANYAQQEVRGYEILNEDGTPTTTFATTTRSSIVPQNTLFDRPRSDNLGAGILAVAPFVIGQPRWAGITGNLAQNPENQRRAIAEAFYWAERYNFIGGMVWSAYDHSHPTAPFVYRDAFGMFDKNGLALPGVEEFRAAFKSKYTVNGDHHLSLIQGNTSGNGSLVNGLEGWNTVTLANNTIGGIFLTGGTQTWTSEEIIYELPLRIRLKIAIKPYSYSWPVTPTNNEVFAVKVFTPANAVTFSYKHYAANTFFVDGTLGSTPTTYQSSTPFLLPTTSGYTIELDIDLNTLSPKLYYNGSLVPFPANVGINELKFQNWQMDWIKLQVFNKLASTIYLEILSAKLIGPAGTPLLRNDRSVSFVSTNTTDLQQEVMRLRGAIKNAGLAVN
jgi:Cellulase (glycosyl hydrolase family 5)